MQRGALAVLLALVLAAGAIAYGEYVLPDGTVSGPSHELANVVKDDARTTVDKNFNGIVDEAESCPTCPAPAGAGPSGAIYGAQGQVLPGGMPVKVPAGASITYLRLTSGCNLVSSSSENSGSLVSIVIDWNARSIKGFIFAPFVPPGQYVGYIIIPGGIGRWNVQNAVSNVAYHHDASVGEQCKWPGWCNTIQLDFENKAITKMPLYHSGCDLFSGVIESA